jgi:hypothetical protein
VAAPRVGFGRISHHTREVNKSVPLLRRSSAGRNPLFRHCLFRAVAHCSEKCGSTPLRYVSESLASNNVTLTPPERGIDDSNRFSTWREPREMGFCFGKSYNFAAFSEDFDVCGTGGEEIRAVARRSGLTAMLASIESTLRESTTRALRQGGFRCRLLVGIRKSATDLCGGACGGVALVWVAKEVEPRTHRK